jgi:hypothetical protein
MTAPRTCRACGADLPADIRWCSRCYEPAGEFSPRAPIHRGDFVDRPIHERGNVPRWSRWEKSATTFGPWGRIVATALLFSTLLPALAYNGFVYAITFPVLATVVLREIWAKGWVVPQEPGEEPVAQPPAAPPAPADTEPISAIRVIRWTLGVIVVAAFAYGPVEVKAAVMGLAAIALLVWFWTAFDS